MRSARQLLVDSLKKDFVPLLISLGWSSHRRAPQFDGSELRRAHPLGYFRRSSDSVVHAADVVFHKRSGRFKIFIGSLPPEGWPSLIEPYEIIPPESLDAGLALDGRILHPKAFWDYDFRYRLFHKPSAAEAERVTAKLIALWPQVEHYFETGQVGKNLAAGPELIMSKQRAKMSG